MLSMIEQVEMLIAFGRGDKYRLSQIRETLESGKELYISDKNFLQNLVKTHLKDRIYQTRVISTPEPEQSLIPIPSTTLESTSGGFTFTDSGDIGESSSRGTAQRKLKSKLALALKPKKKSRQRELEEYEKKYMNELETNVTWEAYDVKAKKKVEIQNPIAVKMKNGKWAVKGTSAITGIKVFRIVGNKKPTI